MARQEHQPGVRNQFKYPMFTNLYAYCESAGGISSLPRFLFYFFNFFFLHSRRRSFRTLDNTSVISRILNDQCSYGYIFVLGTNGQLVHTPNYDNNVTYCHRKETSDGNCQFLIYSQLVMVFFSLSFFLEQCCIALENSNQVVKICFYVAVNLIPA